MRTTRTGAGSAPRPSVDPDQYDWSARDGVIRGRRMLGQASARNVNRYYNPDQDNSTPSEAAQSLLSYHRPLARRRRALLRVPLRAGAGDGPSGARSAGVPARARGRTPALDDRRRERHVGPPGRQRRGRPRAPQGNGPTPPQAERLEHAEALDQGRRGRARAQRPAGLRAPRRRRAIPASSASITTRS